MCQWGDSPVIDLSNTTGETAGTILKVWKYGFFFFFRVGLSTQDAMCQTRTLSLKEEEVSPLWYFAP